MNQNVLQVAAATVAVMAVGTAARLVRMRWAAPEVSRVRRASLLSWWWVILAILAAAILGVGFAVIMFVAVSVAALHEFFVLRQHDIGPRQAVVLSYGLIPASYLWIWSAWPGVYFLFLPLAALFALSACMLVWAPTRGFTGATGQTYWALLLTAYAPGFAVLLFVLPPESNLVAGSAGWFLFLMLLTEFDDISQALIGRALGKRKISPVVSPHKTWEGFIGGVLLTSALGALLAPWLTPWHSVMGMIAGLLVSLTGYLGDLNISGIKRDCGVKDSGTLLPGQGGILDRIDSLTFAAPAFYALAIFWNATGRELAE
jgi:phosphatidate cytidylyltransferase